MYSRDNRKLHHKYKVLETFTAGVVLKGWQVKSILQNLFSFENAFIYINNGEVFCKNLLITPTKESNNVWQFLERKREMQKDEVKLLLTKREINKLIGYAAESGKTLIPGKIYHNGKKLKIDLCVCQGKNQRDKRADLIERDTTRDVARAAKVAKKKTINISDYD